MIRTNTIWADIGGGGATVLAPANPKRVALLFSPPLTGTYTVSPSPNGLEPGHGLNISAGAGPVLVTRALFGDGLDRAWYALTVPGVGSPTAAAVIESFEM